MTSPVVASVGTGTTMLVALQVVGVAGVPLNVTVLEPGVSPKFTPLMVTKAPGGVEIADKLVITGPVVGLGAGRISTALRLYGSLVGAVSLMVTFVPLLATAVETCCTQNVSPGSGHVRGGVTVQGFTSWSTIV
jgi:hypothetical protein